jgi:acetolactate synthase-1/2/3 large subunit
MLGAEIIAKTLKLIGVRRVFLFPGGTIAPLLDALIKERIEYICTINEQGAGYGAIGAAKITGFPQVVMVTSGPGATNVLTPIADAYYDSIPVLVFTGQVATKDINFKRKIRQTGFQETDTINIFKPVTKKAHILTRDEDISRAIFDSFMLTKEGRPGPILIDLPMDVQRNTPRINKIFDSKNKKRNNCNKNKVMHYQIKEILQLLLDSKKPVILAGNGVHISKSTFELREIVRYLNIPVVSSLPGVGIRPSNHKLNFSFIGHTGEYFANLAVYNSDVLIVLGSRLDLRQVGTEIRDFAPNAKIIRVDIDKNELNFGKIKREISINADLKEFLNELLKHIKNEQHQIEYKEWIAQLNKWKSRFNSAQFYKNRDISSYDIITEIDKITQDKKVIVTSGVGIHQQLVPRYFTFESPKRIWFTSAGHGTMGFGLPTAIGAILFSPKEYLGIVFDGDGSFQMNIQELATIKKYNLPIKIFVMDNKKLGMVSQFQLLNWDADPSTGNKKNPSFSKIGKAYGLKGFDIFDKKEIQNVLKEVFKDRSPVVVHCHINPFEEVLPMLLPGQKMNEMYPFDKIKI